MKSPEVSRRQVIKRGAAGLLALGTVFSLSGSEGTPLTSEETDPPTAPIDTLLVQELTQNINNDGQYEKAIPPDMLMELVRIIGNRELAKRKFYGAQISHTEVAITDTSATFDGTLDVPVLGNASIHCTLLQELGKEPSVQKLTLKGSNRFVDIMLDKTNAKERIAKKLQQPYTTIQDYLNDTMLYGTTTITAVELDFQADGNVHLMLEGNPVSKTSPNQNEHP